MTKLPQEAKKYVELNLETSNRTLADEIFQKFNKKTTHTTVGKEKKEILERMERKMERIEEKRPEVPKVPKITDVTPRFKKPVLTKEQFRTFLDQTLTVESFEEVVKQKKTSSAEFLNVKLNPKGKNKAYNQRNKRRYSITFKATLEIAKELLVESFERLKP